MDVQMAISSTVSPSTGTGSSTTAANASTTAGSTDSKGGKTGFMEALGQAVQSTAGNSGESKDGKTVDSALDALLQGFAPVWLSQLMPQLQEAAAADGSASQTVSLEELLGQSESALAEVPAVQGWMAQANELLQALGFPGIAGALANQTQPSGQPVMNDEGADQSAETVSLPQQILTLANQLQTAKAQQPNSQLLQQLDQTFQQTIVPLMLAPLQQGNAGTQDKAKSSEQANMAAAAATGTTTNAETTELSKAVKEFLPNRMTVASASQAESSETRQPQTTQQAAVSKLEVLAFRSGYHPSQLQQAPDSQAAASLELGGDTSEGTVLQQPITIQDLQKSLPADLAKPAIPVQAQTFVQDMSKFMLKTMTLGGQNGMTEARLILTPESLGQVEVKITMHNGQLVAHFAAQTALGKEMIEGQLSQLRSNLQIQGLQVERLEVTQSPSLQSGMFQGDRQQQSSRQFSEQGKARVGEITSTDEDFAAEIADLERIRQDAYGATVDVTA